VRETSAAVVTPSTRRFARYGPARAPESLIQAAHRLLRGRASLVEVLPRPDSRTRNAARSGHGISSDAAAMMRPRGCGSAVAHRFGCHRDEFLPRRGQTSRNLSRGILSSNTSTRGRPARGGRRWSSAGTAPMTCRGRSGGHAGLRQLSHLGDGPVMGWNRSQERLCVAPTGHWMGNAVPRTPPRAARPNDHGRTDAPMPNVTRRRQLYRALPR